MIEGLEQGSAVGGVWPRVYASDIFAHTELQAAPVFEGLERVRPNLKVQDGCDNRCSFCVIPFVRGQSRSLPLDKISAEIELLERAGFREIVISGINLGRWGRDFSSQNRLIGLLNHVLERSNVAKLRLSSIEPMDWTDELITLMASSSRICKHAHVPLQSGSDKILRKMHRKYRPWHYAEKLEKIRSAMPHAAIGADIMVGFPGETDALFEESRRFIEEMPFTYLHVFTYSPRPGTPAAALPDQVPVQIARERNRILRQIGAKKNHDFRSTFVGQELEAITLRRSLGSECTEALSDNYVKLEFRGQYEPNRLIKIRVDSLSEAGLVGNLSR
jgi:threonylcarbamoyladenosine tRNA methylthiotransferase MtaB